MNDDFDPYRKWLGIPPEEQPPHHYRLLGIAVFEDDPDVISNAADRQMAHVRTFQTGKRAAQSQEILNELSAAKVCLLDRERKAAYDHELRLALGGTADQLAPGRSWGPPAAPTIPPRVGIPVAAPVRRLPTAGPTTVAEATPVAGIGSRPVPAALVAQPPAEEMPVAAVRSSSRPLRPARRPSQAPIVGAVVAVAALAILALVLLQSLDKSSHRSTDESRSTSANASISKPNGASSVAKPSNGRSDAEVKTSLPVKSPPKVKREPRKPRPDEPLDLPERAPDSPREESPAESPPRDSPFRPRPDDKQGPEKSPPRNQQPSKDEPQPEPKPAVANRPPLPEKKLIDRAVGILRGEYKQALADAKSPQARTDLANALLTKAETASDAATKVAMLELARLIAVQLADVDLLCRTVDVLAAHFDVDLPQVKHDTLKEAASLPLRPEQYRKFLPPIKQGVAEAMRTEDTDRALQYARLQKVVAAKLNDAIDNREALHQERDLREHDKLLKKFKEFEKAPLDNAEANLHVGRYLCFIRRDWKAGLARLSKGADPKLAELAAADAAGPTDPAKQVEIADGWLQIARRNEATFYKQSTHERAKHWYQQAVDKLPEAEKKKVEARLAEVGGGVAAKS